MTNQNEYEGESYRLRLLKSLKSTTESIDGKVEELMEQVEDFFEEYRADRGEWSPEDLDRPERNYRR